MKAKNWQRTIVFVAALALLLVAITSPAALWADPSENSLEDAWIQANEIGQYQFSTEVVQITSPLPTLANAGKGSQTERLYLEGNTDILAETMALKLWSGGGSTALDQGSIELKVSDGLTFGRIGDGEWEQVDNLTDFFAPNNDPLFFISAAENVVNLGVDSRADITFTQYSFDIDSLTFAQQMRRQMEAQLAQEGTLLPQGIHLEVPRFYTDMIGRGELWVGENGLPIRQTTYLEFPASGQEKVDVEIVTDFTGWGTHSKQSAGAIVTAANHLISHSNIIAIGGFYFAIFLSLPFFMVIAGRRKKVYNIFAVSQILIFVLSPLLQTQQAHAFTESLSRHMSSENSAYDTHDNQASAVENEATSSGFSPVAGQTNLIPLQVDNPVDPDDVLFYDDGLDEDNDGLSNAQETEFFGTDPRNADSDNDNLDDNVEISELGTNPLNEDTDGDNIPDWAEVEGFLGADNQRWYLDPLVGDSGGNGEPDGTACRMETPTRLVCLDTDDDNVPDVYDLDNDGDGVPDTVDSAPETFLGDKVSGLEDKTFEFDLNNVTADEPIYVDFQLRPTNPDHLWYSLSKLDWPENDQTGQVQSMLDTPFKIGEPGDMRLVPMLEIKMGSTPLPLPLTNPETSVSFSGSVTGTVELAQQGADVLIGFSLPHTDQYTANIYNLTCGEIEDATIPELSVGPLSDGQTSLALNKVLNQTYADGGRSLNLVSANGEASCRPIPNIINGGHSFQMVDLTELQPYSISVRELNESGELMAYVPLVLLYEQADNMPVAFTGRMYYQPEQADFGGIEEARLAWMVMTNTDRCSSVPDDFDPDPDRDDETEAELVEAWCADSANWIENGPQLVHAYYDDWHLTGLSVQRNLGLKTAVVYEDPTFTAAQSGYDPDGFNDDNLWSLALGLDVSLLAGRDDGLGGRDLTIDEVAARWDKNSNGAATATDRWDIPQDALVVERFDFPDPSGVALLAQTHAYEVLENTFTSQALTGGIQDPTLLFLQETRMRSMSIGFDDLVTTVGNNGVTLDIANSDQMPEIVVAGMNWVPYQFNGSWQSYNLEEYWVDKGADMDAALALTPDWTAEDVEGASFIARAYYISMAAGVNQIVEIDGLAATLPSFIADGEMQELLVDSNPLVGTGKAVKNVVSKSISAVTKIVGKDIFLGGKLGGVFKSPNLLNSTQKTLLENKRGAINLGSEAITPASLAKAYGMDSNLLGADSMAVLKRQASWSDGLGSASTVLAAAAAVTGLIAAGIAFVDKNAAKIITVVSNSIAFVATALSIASLVIKLKVVVALNGLTSFSKVLSHFGKLASVSKSNAVFFIISQVISFGFFVFSVVAAGIAFGSLGFNQMLADFIAGVAVAVVLLLISSIPVVGQLIAAIVAIIDVLITTICSLIPEEDDTETGATVRNYACAGISGLLGKLISWLIYDQMPLVELDREDRLNLTNFDFALTNPNLGYSFGNQLNVAVDVQSALYINNIDDASEASVFAVYRWQFTDENIKETTLVYTMTHSAIDIHEDLEVGTMEDEWQEPTAGGFAEDSNFVITKPVDNNSGLVLKTGVNTRHPLWLTEGQAFNVQECVMAPILPPVPVCWLRTDRTTTHLDLSEVVIFDVFPETIDGFYQLASAGSQGYKLSWDESFPILQDADGDGLISAEFGGADPADNTPDLDGDGLSDFYELQQSNSDPRQRDTDSDGLCDDQEVYFGTDPNRADTDSDGLVDSVEVFHQDICDYDDDNDTTEWIGGWDFIYAYDGNSPLRTRVVPSPFTVNPDGDAYTDAFEQVYGFNPNVASSGGILNLSSQIGGDNIVRPGETLDYTAELENGLRTNFALGLLDVQFESAVSVETVNEVAFSLAPQKTISTTGQVTIDPAITQSQEISMTNRAGALIVDPLEAVDGRSLWLRMDDSPASSGGEKVYADDSLNNWEATCPDGFCPIDNTSGYRNSGLEFVLFDFLELDDGLGPIGLTESGFTVDLWFYRNAGTNDAILLGSGSGGLSWRLRNGQLQIQDGTTAVVNTGATVVTEDQWHQLTWRYDGFNQVNTFFVDGLPVHNTTFDLTTLLAENSNEAIILGAANNGAIFDEYSIYPFSLADSQIATLGQDQVFYLRGETDFVSPGPSSITDDSSFQNTITCDTDVQNDTGCLTAEAVDGVIDQGYRWGNSGSSTNDNPIWVEPSPNLDLSSNSGAFAISTWLSPSESPGIGGSGYVMGYGDATGSSEYLYPTIRVDPDNGGGDGITDFYFTIGIENEAGDHCEVSAYGEAPNQEWHHVGVVFNGLQFEVYLDNQPIDPVDIDYAVGGAGAVSNCNGITPRAGSQFYVGGAGTRDFDTSNSGFYFNGNAFSGAIDELRIFNYELNAEEISDIYWDELPIFDLRLDEPPASDVFPDRSFNNADATCALAGGTCPLTGLPGRDNQAARFDGTNDFLTIPDADQLQIVDSAFTLAGWVYRTDNGSNPIIGGDTADTLFFGLNGSGIPQLEIDGTTATGGNAIPVQEWHHVAARYSYPPSVSSGIITLFIDGSAVFTQTSVTPLPANETLYVGRETNNYFSGLLDRVAVYRQALSNEDILELTNQVPRVNLHFDDPVGSGVTFANAGDASLVAQCVSLLDCPQNDIKGRVYGGVLLDGENDFIFMQDSAQLDFDRFSVGMWLMPTQQRTGSQTIIKKGDAFDLYIEQDSMQVGYSVGVDNCVSQAAAVSTGAMTENVWNHLMLVYDDAAEEVRLYINGSLDTTTPGIAPACQNNTAVHIGRTSSNLYFSGSLDELVMYPDALSDRDIADLFSYQLAWFDTEVGHRLLIDADLPTVSLNVSAPFLPNEDKILAISAGDATTEITLVEYNVNGAGWQEATPDIQAWLFNFSPSGDGSYTIELRATDEAGNVGSSNQTIEVDGTGPILGPLNIDGVSAVPAPYDASQDAWSVDLSGSVTTAGSPLDNVMVNLLDDLGASVSGIMTTTVDSGVWQIDYPFSVQPNGTYTVHVKASDMLGNVTTVNVAAPIDGTPPNAEVTFTGDNEFLINSAVTLSGLVTDTGEITSGISEVELALHLLGENDKSAVENTAGLRFYQSLDLSTNPATRNVIARFDNLAGLAYTRYPASCTDCPTNGAAGYLGNSLLFDGVSNQLIVENLGTEIDEQAFSMSAWVYPNGVTGKGTVLAFGNNGAVATQLLYDAGSQTFVYQDSSGETAASGSFPAGQWHQVTVTVDPNGAGALYVNGVSAATFTASAQIADSDSLLIGLTAGMPFGGRLDEVAVHNRALTATEVGRFHRGSFAVVNIPFDDADIDDGALIQDDSRFDHAATYHDGTPGLARPEDGIVGGGSLQLNGDSWIELLDHAALDLSAGEFTQMVWVYPQAGGPIIDSIMSDGDIPNAYPFLASTADQLVVGFGDGSNLNSYTTASLLTPNSWNFVAVTFDGTDYDIYINGELRDSTNQFAGLSPAPTTRFNIGYHSQTAATDYFEGKLDELTIYRQTLSADQILAKYRQGWQLTDLTASGPSVVMSDWEYLLPDVLAGSYEIQLRTSDENGNVSFDHDDLTIWEGYIDTNPHDDEGIFYLELGDSTVVESAGTAVVTVTLTSPNRFTTQVDYATTAGTATAGSDFTNATGTLTFAPNETVKTFNIPILDDATEEQNETLTIALSNPVSTTLGNPFTGTLTIIDDEGNPEINFSSGALSIGESDGTGQLTIVLDHPVSNPVTVQVQSADLGTANSATAGADYTSVNQTVTFAPGETSQTVSVAILPDNEIEQNEGFNLTLSNPSNGNLGTVTTALVTIIDDDSGPINVSTLIYLPIVNRSVPSGPDLIIESIDVVGGAVELTVKNTGNIAVTNAFWVDLFINPTVVPTKVNDTTEALGQPGLVWGINPALLPIEPGASFKLTVGDSSFVAAFSTFSGTISAGDRLIAHVDSANSNTTYGAVNESHEMVSGVYNNITETIAPAGAIVSDQFDNLDRQTVPASNRP